MRSRVHALALGLALVVGSLACSAPFATDDGSAPDEETGHVEIALSIVPVDVGCLRLTATGTTRTVERRVLPSTRVAVDGLPVGDVILTAEAHAERCDVFDPNARSTWVASPVVTTLAFDTPTPITLVFVPLSF
jgi:hypothetical protein